MHADQGLGRQEALQLLGEGQSPRVDALDAKPLQQRLQRRLVHDRSRRAGRSGEEQALVGLRWGRPGELTVQLTAQLLKRLAIAGRSKATRMGDASEGIGEVDGVLQLQGAARSQGRQGDQRAAQGLH